MLSQQSGGGGQTSSGALDYKPLRPWVSKLAQWVKAPAPTTPVPCLTIGVQSPSPTGENELLSLASDLDIHK